jgi:phosphoenolpyruvate carboxylase
MKHLKHASETLDKKTTRKYLKIVANICNIQINTLATYIPKHR